MRINLSIFLASLTALWIAEAAPCLAQDNQRPSNATNSARQGSKARAYADREDDSSQPGRSAAEVDSAKNGDRPQGLDDATVEKTRGDLDGTFKSLEKAFDLFK